MQGRGKEEIEALVAAELDARMKGAKSTSSNRAKSKKKKSFDMSKIRCYCCLEYGLFPPTAIEGKKRRHLEADCQGSKDVSEPP